MSNFVIDTNGLLKSFNGHLVLDKLDLEVPKGSIFGFLGRNGAGKTTTIKLLMGLLRADGGAARIFGLPVSDRAASVEIRRRVGFVTEDKDLYPYMTVGQLIRFTRPFFPKWRADLESRYLKMFTLPLDRKIADLSKGMRSKLMLLLAMCHSAELLILDEPADGLDPVASEDMLRELVAASAAEGTTVFFSSHHLPEVEQIADHVMILEQGRAVVAGSLDDLKSRYQRLRIVFDREPASSPGWLAAGNSGIVHMEREGRTVSILARENADVIAAEARSVPGASVESFPVSLKEIFMEHVRNN